MSEGFSLNVNSISPQEPLKPLLSKVEQKIKYIVYGEFKLEKLEDELRALIQLVKEEK